MWTLSSLQMHPYAMIVVDEDATLELQVKTVKVRSPPQTPSPTNQVPPPKVSAQPLPTEQPPLNKRDSVLEKLDSPRSPKSKSFLAPPKPDLIRQVTPELVPDSMHTRLPERPTPALATDGPEMKDLPLSAMHERVDSPRA